MLDSLSWYILSSPFFIAFLIFEMRKKKKFSQIILHGLIFIYFLAVVSITIFPLPIQKQLIEDSREVGYLHNNFVPFRSLIGMIGKNPLFVTVPQFGHHRTRVLWWPYDFIAIIE